MQGGWLAVFVATLSGLLLYGPYAEALGLGDMFSTTLLGDTLGTRFGQVWLVRLVLLLAMAPLLVLLFRRDPESGDAAPAAALVDGGDDRRRGPAVPHARSRRPRLDRRLGQCRDRRRHDPRARDGGLARRPRRARARHALAAARRSSARDAVERFSRVALGCIVALVATGAFQTWRQVGSLDALRSTDYGRILVVKLVLVALVIVFAAFSREVVLRILPPPPPEPSEGVPVVAGGSDDDDDEVDDEEYEIDEEVELRRLRRSVWAEIVTRGR